MSVRLWFLAFGVSAWLCAAGGLQAQTPEDKAPPEASTGAAFDPFDVLKWKKGPGKLDVGAMASVELKDGFRLIDGKESQKFYKMTGNMEDQRTQAIVQPIGRQGDDAWFLCFDWSDSGYIKDEEKDSLDADAMLKSLQEGNEAANPERKRLGLPAMHIVGWALKPTFDERTKNLVWATKLQTDNGGVSVNYEMRILGRKGYMGATLVCGEVGFSQLRDEAHQVVDAFAFNPGETYGEFTAGDKVAEYGLAALVVGGGAAIAAKTGILAKLIAVFGKSIKAIVIGVIALFAGIGKLLFGKKSSAE